MGVVTNFKRSPIRLHGAAIKRLQNRIYERDKGVCVVCGVYVDPGVKFHHEPPKSHGGQDIEQNGVILCMKCHRMRHGGARSREVKAEIEKYLQELYGE